MTGCCTLKPKVSFTVFLFEKKVQSREILFGDKMIEFYGGSDLVFRENRGDGQPERDIIYFLFRIMGLRKQLHIYKYQKQKEP